MQCKVKKVPWEEIRGDVAHLNARLGESLDLLPSGAELSLFDVWYPYGSLIVDGGRFLPPCGAESKLCPPCRQLREAVEEGYGDERQTIPLTLVLSACVEVFVTVTGERIRGQPRPSVRPRIVPLRVVTDGEVFGSYETTDLLLNAGPSFAPWSVSAGGRSLFILARLKSTKALRLLSQALEAPSILRQDCDDWELIHYYAVHKNLDWGTRVLIITHPGDVATPRFRETVFDIAWRQSRTARVALFDELVSSEETRRVSGVDPTYYNSTIRHIRAITRGEVPAFAPVRDKNSEAAPLTEFQEFLTSNGLCREPYFPAVLQPVHLGPNANVVYYSLNLPTIVARVQENFKTVRRFAEMIDTDLRQLAKREDLTHVDMQCLGPRVRPARADWHPSDARLLKADFGLVDLEDAFNMLDLGDRFFEACVRIALK